MRMFLPRKSNFEIDHAAAIPNSVFNGTAAATLNAGPFGNNFGGNEAVSEAFDEPLTKEQVTAIVTPFLAA